MVTVGVGWSDRVSVRHETGAVASWSVATVSSGFWFDPADARAEAVAVVSPGSEELHCSLGTSAPSSRSSPPHSDLAILTLLYVPAASAAWPPLTGVSGEISATPRSASNKR